MSFNDDTACIQIDRQLPGDIVTVTADWNRRTTAMTFHVNDIAQTLPVPTMNQSYNRFILA